MLYEASGTCFKPFRHRAPDLPRTVNILNIIACPYWLGIPAFKGRLTGAHSLKQIRSYVYSLDSGV